MNPTKLIEQNPDGTYTWTYEYNLYKNPSIFFLIWRIFFLIILSIFAFLTIHDAISFDDFFPGRLLTNLKFFGYFIAGMTAVSGLAYLIYAASMGGKYTVDFTMDEKGINHAQIPAQAKKAKKLGRTAFAAGAASGRFGAMSAGIAAQRTEMYSEFAKVKKIKAYRRRGLIKVNETLNHNQVYVFKEDFDFVLGYISERCPNAKKKG
ncbi:MAG: hypothetical protein IJS45_03000 [Clostridia bacterium]|nr:hypothetical protein [Clostridia bacterium]